MSADEVADIDDPEPSQHAEYREALAQALDSGDPAQVLAVRDAEMEQLRAQHGHQFGRALALQVALWECTQQRNARDAELAGLRAELAGLRERAIVLPEDWAAELEEAVDGTALDANPGRAFERVADLVESWRVAPGDTADDDHSAERAAHAENWEWDIHGH